MYSSITTQTFSISVYPSCKSVRPLSNVPGWHYTLVDPALHIWLGNICSPAGNTALNTKGDNYTPLLGLVKDKGPLYYNRPWPLCVPLCLQVGNNDKDASYVSQPSLNNPHWITLYKETVLLKNCCCVSSLISQTLSLYYKTYRTF